MLHFTQQALCFSCLVRRLRGEIPLGEAQTEPHNCRLRATTCEFRSSCEHKGESEEGKAKHSEEFFYFRLLLFTFYKNTDC